MWCSGADVKEIKKQVKYLLQNLQDSMNTLIFTQDSYKDGCWLLNPDLKKPSEVRAAGNDHPSFELTRVNRVTAAIR